MQGRRKQFNGASYTDTAASPSAGAPPDVNTSGYVKFGTHTDIGAEEISGYITIKDADGNLRKLAVVS